MVVGPSGSVARFPWHATPPWADLRERGEDAARLLGSEGPHELAAHVAGRTDRERDGRRVRWDEVSPVPDAWGPQCGRPSRELPVAEPTRPRNATMIERDELCDDTACLAAGSRVGSSKRHTNGLFEARWRPRLVQEPAQPPVGQQPTPGHLREQVGTISGFAFVSSSIRHGWKKTGERRFFRGYRLVVVGRFVSAGMQPASLAGERLRRPRPRS